MAVAKKTASAASCAETGEAWQRTQQDETPNAVIGRFEHLANRNGSLLQVWKTSDGLFVALVCAKTLHSFDTVSGRIRLLLAALPALQVVEGRRAAVLCRLSRQPLLHGVSKSVRMCPKAGCPSRRISSLAGGLTRPRQFSPPELPLQRAL